MYSITANNIIKNPTSELADLAKQVSTFYIYYFEITLSKVILFTYINITLPIIGHSFFINISLL